MFLSKNPNGKYYIYYLKPNGTRTSISTKTRLKSEALKFLANFEQELKNRQTEKTIPITLKQFEMFFIKFSESVHTANTTATYKSSFKSFLDYFGKDVLLSSITTKKMNEYFQFRLKNPSIFQARKDRINLGFAFNKAVEENFIQENPLNQIKRFKIPEIQPLFFSKKEFLKLLKVIDEKVLRDLILFAVNTGLRQMELLSLQWNQIDLERKFIILNNRNHLTKSKKVRTIPLNEVTYKILSRRKIKVGYLFLLNNEPIEQDFISKKFKKFVKAAKINSELNFHSLRHTFASWLIQKGVPIYEVSKLLGHADIKTTEIYAHLQPEHLRNSVNALNNILNNDK